MTDKKANPAGRLIRGKTLTFKLEDADKLALGAQAAKLDGEIEEIEAEFKEVKSGFRQRLKERSEERARLLKAVHTGQEERESDCTEVRDQGGNTISFWVGGRMIEERAMTFEERQEELSLSNGKAIAQAAASPPPGSIKKKKRSGKDEAAEQGKKPTDESEDIANVRKLETNKRTKLSAVDGIYPNGQ